MIDPAELPVENQKMLFVLIALIVFVFLVMGSIAFLICVLLPPTRRYALSAALWFAVCGPCSACFVVIAGLGLAGGALVMKAGKMQWTDSPRLLGTLGWSYLVVGALVTIGAATGAAWLHQWLIHRFTFALFRIYVTAVSAGIGSVLGWWLGWWMTAKGVNHLGVLWWALGMLIFIQGFGVAAYKNARRLRGKAPTGFTWISPEEFAGSDNP
ncbi:MAG: hypothetical protein WCA11_13755, partial [Terracidiphilus sp.]